MIDISSIFTFTISFVAATQWMAKWKRNDWKTSSKEDVKNKEDFIKLDSILSDIKINWV